jgi:hypothetical protein
LFRQTIRILFRANANNTLQASLTVTRRANHGSIARMWFPQQRRTYVFLAALGCWLVAPHAGPGGPGALAALLGAALFYVFRLMHRASIWPPHLRAADHRRQIWWETPGNVSGWIMIALFGLCALSIYAALIGGG